MLYPRGVLRSFRPQDFIHLPPLSEAGTLTLVDDLEAAVKSANKAPPAVFASLGRLLEACSTLKKHIALRERAGSAADPVARAADRALDDAWAALQTWMLGWTRLPDRAHARVADARRVYADLFPKGLQFLTLDFKDEWKESQERLDRIAGSRYDELFDALGGAAFLATIAGAHRGYGEALQITSSSRDEPDSQVRTAVDATHMALREYVAQVAATVRRDEPQTVEMADVLLAPLSARAIEDVTQDREGDDDTLVSARAPVS
jgi:hypothetical protein